MASNHSNLLSFIIKATGEVVPAMPDEGEFSAQQIRDHVAGNRELVCETCDGFLLFRNRDASTHGLPLNALATSVYTKYARRPCALCDRVFLSHPHHVPAYWRRTLRSTMNRRRESA